MTIDLRSDTVTRPSEAMRRAMAAAEVGDDVYGEDPTVKRAGGGSAPRLLGFEAALFVPSGTMGNQIALHLPRAPGGEVMCEARSHIVGSGDGRMAALSGMMPRPVARRTACSTPADVERAIAPDVSYRSRTALLVIENSHNMAGGTVYDRPRLDALLAVARRAWPARAPRRRAYLQRRRWRSASRCRLSRAGFDSLMFCLSKGLGAPVGSLLCGRRDFVTEARRVRKMLGGGMRQVGILAAAGLVALRKGPARLAEDHENAGCLARDSRRAARASSSTSRPCDTNIVIFRLTPRILRRRVLTGGRLTAAFLTRLTETGVLGSTGQPRSGPAGDPPRRDRAQSRSGDRRIAGAGGA